MTESGDSTLPAGDDPRATDPQAREAVLAEVARAIDSIRFGSVLVKIHDGEVVGIETSTKVRFKGGRS
jgi:hypothetical protein